MGELESTFNENYSKIIIMQNIYMCKNYKKLSISKLARTLKYSPNDVYFNDVVKYLISKDVLKINKTKGKYEILSIDYKKFNKLYEETEFFKRQWDFHYIRTGGALIM